MIGVDSQRDYMERPGNSAAPESINVEGRWDPDFVHQIGLPHPLGRNAVGLEHGKTDPVGAKVTLKDIALTENDLRLMRLDLTLPNDIQHTGTDLGGLFQKKGCPRPINVPVRRFHPLPI